VPESSFLQNPKFKKCQRQRFRISFDSFKRKKFYSSFRVKFAFGIMCLQGDSGTKYGFDGMMYGA